MHCDHAGALLAGGRVLLHHRSSTPSGQLTNPGRKANMALSADVRRVVTTIDKNDKAVVLLDGANPHKKGRPQAQTVSRLLWVTDQSPADLAVAGDPAAIDIG